MPSPAARAPYIRAMERRQVVVRRSLPTDPAVRAGSSLYLAETAGQGLALRRQLVQAGPQPAPAHVAERLGLTPGQPAWARRRLFFADEVPVRLSTSWFLVELAEGTPLGDPDFVGEGLQAHFEGRGLRFGRLLETLTARPPTAEEAAALELSAPEPVVQILRSSYEAGGLHVHTLESICAAGRHLFEIRPLPDDRVF